MRNRTAKKSFIRFVVAFEIVVAQLIGGDALCVIVTGKVGRVAVYRRGEACKTEKSPTVKIIGGSLESP